MVIKTRLTKRAIVQKFAEGVIRGDRVVLSRAITLIESSRTNDRSIAEDLIEKLLPHTGKSVRIGVTGAPGAGKSTFIEVFGKYITSVHKKLAVLAIDPSSQKTKGSILGDKTRMEELSRDPRAFIRPTPTGDSLGGVAHATRETMLLCEAAGYDVVLIETVGVGQSEVAVRGMVDFFLLLMLAGAGDELQGIKKGIMEMADGIAITKADGENVKKATQAQADFQHALHWLQPAESGWAPKVLTLSALSHTGIMEIWKMIEEYEQCVRSSGSFDRQRRHQKIAWFHESFDALIKKKVLSKSKSTLATFEKKVLANLLSPDKAAKQLMKKLMD